MLALGASQKVTDRWTMFYGANYYFNESAKIDKDVEYKNLLTDETEILDLNMITAGKFLLVQNIG